MPQKDMEDMEDVTEALERQHERLAKLRRKVAESTRRNRALHRRLMEEQKLMKRELERVQKRLARLGRART